MAVTIKDVAEKAEVSISTVSKVLNGRKTISESTTEKVQKVIRELNYTPNSRAVNFASKKSKNIIFLAEFGTNIAYSNPHMFDIMCGAFEQVSKEGYTLTLMDPSTDLHPKETVSELIYKKGADGIIVHGSAFSNDIADLILENNFPHIIIGHPDYDSRLCWIDTDHVLAGQFAADYLVQNKIKNPAFIGGLKNEFISSERLKGFSKTLRHAKIKTAKDNIIYTDSSWQMGYANTLKLLLKENAPDAIICENNSIAVGCARGIRESDKNPVFLTFDLFPYTKIMDPKPVIIDINVYDMGVQAGSIIVRKINNPSLMIQSFTTLPNIITN